MNQNRKKHIKSRVFIPEEAGIELAISFTLGHIIRSITRTQVPPMLDCTPYHMLQSGHSQSWTVTTRRAWLHHERAPHTTPRLEIHHRLPNMPKLVRLTTGNVTWSTAPGRAFNTRNGVAIPYPSQTQIQACHHDMPSCIMDDTIIHLLILNRSTTQLPECQGDNSGARTTRSVRTMERSRSYTMSSVPR